MIMIKDLLNKLTKTATGRISPMTLTILEKLYLNIDDESGLITDDYGNPLSKEQILFDELTETAGETALNNLVDINVLALVNCGDNIFYLVNPNIFAADKNVNKTLKCIFFDNDNINERSNDYDKKYKN